MAAETMSMSANAVPGRGGQGQNLFHMIEGARTSFDLLVYCKGRSELCSTVQVPGSRAANVILGTRAIRRLRDWGAYLENRNFDQFVAARLAATRYFQGVTGQCLRSLKQARKLGARLLLDVINTYIDDTYDEQLIDCRSFGVRPPTNSAIRAQSLAEYEVADRIRVMSDHGRRTFLSRGFAPERVTVVRPPIDVSEFPQACFTGPKFRISFVGLLEPWKGIQYLLEAFRLLNRKDCEVVLWGASGSRPMSGYLQEQTAHNPEIKVEPVEVRAVGYGAVYGTSHVLVHPSSTDGFAYVVAEGMASGLPVIATTATGAAELIRENENGFVVPPRDSRALAERLEYLMDHPARLREMGESARRAAAECTIEKFRQDYKNFVTA